MGIVRLPPARRAGDMPGLGTADGRHGRYESRPPPVPWITPKKPGVIHISPTHTSELLFLVFSRSQRVERPHRFLASGGRGKKQFSIDVWAVEMWITPGSFGVIHGHWGQPNLQSLRVR